MTVHPGFAVTAEESFLFCRCRSCGWAARFNASDASRFWHSMKVHETTFCPLKGSLDD